MAKRVKRLLTWLGSNAEALIALVLAIVAGTLGLIGVAPPELVDSATLATLAALSLAVLRDRWRNESEPDVRAAALVAKDALLELPEHIARISAATT
ncbi:hypothetical protein FDA94_29980 [Herbidospora galbida]|uniref:Holin n=1 Tax=Herbidospora galbida TaxID=2575442 RepID=A0A4U3M827_9ACTN|nr:hypothetical protein [Herbidospora galbida]TKK84369.1 hypothetical protein FDA94_29980 [Herbidospora galbida]